MQITIEICTGADHRREVTKQDIQRNIDALQRMINGKPLASDFIAKQVRIKRQLR